MQKKIHTLYMRATRKSIRYDDIGRIDSPQICPLSGVLDNISKDGCKVHYPLLLTIDFDKDYEIKVRPSKAVNGLQQCFILLCHPQWIKDDKSSTEIGFRILRSPDYTAFLEYIAMLENDIASQNVENQIVGSVCQVV